MLRQLERNGNLRRYVHGLAIVGCRTESDLLRHALGFLIQAMAQSMKHSVYHHLPAGQERHAQHHISFDVQLLRFARVAHRWLGENFHLRRANYRSGHRRRRGGLGHRRNPRVGDFAVVGGWSRAGGAGNAGRSHFA